MSAGRAPADERRVWPDSLPASPAEVRPSRSAQLRSVQQGWGGRQQLTLLLGDPDSRTSGQLAGQLDEADVQVVVCGHGAEVLLQVGRIEPDVVLLAARLPRVDVVTVTAAVRELGASPPILIGVDKGDAEQAGRALMAGGSALVQRPYRLRQVLGELATYRPRVEARNLAQAVLRYGPMELDSLAYSVRLDGRELELPLKEFELLRALMLHADHVVSGEQLRAEAWGGDPDAATANTVAVHISRLRARVGGHEVLRTVRGLGYRLTFPTAGKSGHRGCHRH